MKSKLQALLIASLIIGLPSVVLLTEEGCATTGGWQSVAGRFLATTATTVDGAMQGWAAYVVTSKTPDTNQAPVRQLYAEYQAVFAVATNAYVLAVSTGNQSAFTGPSNQLFTVKTKVLTATAH